MRSILGFPALSVVIFMLLYISCKKEPSCEGCTNGNKPLIAIAGPDQVITLPTDSVSLDGRSSRDPDGTITSFLWTKISGPASFNIIKASDSITKVKTLAIGVYQFELKVTDNCGLSAKDTVQITVNDRGQSNRPPVANAGADQTITLPTNTVNLDGSGSSDPDNNITNYAWTKISGQTSFNITNSNAVQTQVTNLVLGTYQFELKVTDAGGLFSKDTMKVTVNPEPPSSMNICEPVNRPIVNAQLVPVGALSLARSYLTASSAGNKILFAGGQNQSAFSLSRVDIYDLTSQNWSTAELSQPRISITSVAAGNKIFFAGGYVSTFGVTSRIDIYDAVTNSWSTAELSEPRVEMATAVIGNKVFFAGGQNYSSGTNTPISRVDIYDISSNTWSTAQLSQPRFGLSATNAGNKIYFAGGWNFNDGLTSNVIDIYDGQTASWSISSMATHKAYHAAIAIQNKIFWAGGDTLIDLANEIALTCHVEIRNINSQTSTFMNLFQPNHGFAAFEKDNKIAFLPGWGWWDATAPNKFDIYDVVSNTWSIGQLNQGIPDAALISVNGIIYVVGGHDNNFQYYNKVWKLEF